MPIGLQKFERYPSVDRNDFAITVLNYCRAYRAQEKITGARFFWVDGGNTIGVLVEGQPGCFDYNPNPDANFLKALAAAESSAELEGAFEKSFDGAKLSSAEVAEGELEGDFLRWLKKQ